MRFSRLMLGIAAVSLSALSTLAGCSSSGGDDAPSDSAARAAALAALSGDSSGTGVNTGGTVVGATPKPMEETGLPELDLLRVLMDHHQALIALAEAALARSDASADVRDDARRIAEQQRIEVDSMQAISERALREHHTPTVLPKEQATNAGTLAKSGAAFDRAFRDAVIAHHREGIRTIDEYLPNLTHVRLKLMLRRMRDDEAREIAAMRQRRG